MAMQETQDLLIEIGCEELPPKSLLTLSEHFKALVMADLNMENLSYSTIKAFATPRRLALVIENLQTQQSDRQIEKKGPPVTAGMKDGQATPALLGFAKSCGVEVEDLSVSETDKGAWYTMTQTIQGKQTAQLIPGIVEKALNQLPIAKRMRWANHAFEFVRPLRWLILLLGDKVIEAEILGVSSKNTTRGHRFHTKDVIRIQNPAEYEEVLRTQGFVIADFQKRKQKIQEEVKKQTLEHEIAVIKPELLDEVCALVEWPVALIGRFEEQFLQVPQEALISTMQDNQKYFPIVDETGALQSKFCFIANLESKDPQQVIHGNERVIRPRFSDAEFFWNEDKKVPLGDYLPRLEKVVFQTQLGSQADKIRRVAKLAQSIAQQLDADVKTVHDAAFLSKSDLLSNMVQEFPELQGTMGRYYALHENQTPLLADCLEQIYWPRFSGDQLPVSKEAQALAIAERMDTIVGIFAIGQIPTGSKDPYSLRRNALGVLRIMIEGAYPLDLSVLIEQSFEQLPDTLRKDKQNISKQILLYFLERLKAYIVDRDAVPVDSFESVVSLGIHQPFDIVKRVEAVTRFRGFSQASALSNANKRIENILRKNQIHLQEAPKEDLFIANEEKQLFAAAKDVETSLNPLKLDQAYDEMLQSLLSLAQPLEAFFDQVMVMCEEEALRTNRLKLISFIQNLFHQVADLSILQE